MLSTLRFVLLYFILFWGVFKLYINSYCEETKNVFLKQGSGLLKLLGSPWRKLFLLKLRPVQVCLHCFLGRSKSGVFMDVLLVPEREAKAESFTWGVLKCSSTNQWPESFHFVPMWFLWVVCCFKNCFKEVHFFFSWQSCVSCVSIFHY